MTASLSAPRSVPSLRDRLRADTREAHEALDASFEGMFTDASGTLYRRFIAMNVAAHEAIEPVLAKSPLAYDGDDEPSGTRLDAARQDAAALGIAPLAPPAFPLPQPDLFESFGIAYVLEGSRLGAKFMSRAIKRDERPGDASRPTYYLEASSDAQPFIRLLDRMAAEPADEAQIGRAIEAADATFRYFRALCGDDQERTTRV